MLQSDASGQKSLCHCSRSGIRHSLGGTVGTKEPTEGVVGGVLRLPRARPTHRSAPLPENGSTSSTGPTGLFTTGPIGLFTRDRWASPLPNRLDHPLPDRLDHSLPDRLASSLGTHRFAEAIFGFEIRHRKLLQRRLRARPVLGALHRDHHQKGPSEETVHRETLKQFLASKNELHFVPQTETVFGEKWRKNEPRQGGKSEPGLGGKVNQAWGEKWTHPGRKRHPFVGGKCGPCRSRIRNQNQCRNRVSA